MQMIDHYCIGVKKLWDVKTSLLSWKGWLSESKLRPITSNAQLT